MTNNKITFTFRPHHFLCNLGFRGCGYSDDFTKNFKKIHDQSVLNPEETVFKITFGMDSICGPCPHNQQQSVCTEQAKIEKLDRAHAAILQLKNHDVITWRAAQQRLKRFMTISNFHQACAECEWKALGYCETALRDLRKRGSEPESDSDSD